MRIDLHVHSNYSDGSDSPAKLIELAEKKGLFAFALTDHDTVDGIEEALEAAEESNVKVIPGIEVSCEYEGQDIHILGLNVDINSSKFQNQLTAFRKERESRNDRMLQKMQDCGLPIQKEDFYKRYPGAVITRAHFAEYLMEQGAVSSVQEAFERYIGAGCPCYLPKHKITCKQAIDTILLGNGHPVLAHPLQYKLTSKKLESLIEELKSYGLEGMEVFYSLYDASKQQYLQVLANKFNLQISGGSDYHGTKKPDISIGTGRGSLYVHHDVMNWLFE